MLWRQIELSALCSNINRVFSPARYMHCTVLYKTRQQMASCQQQLWTVQLLWTVAYASTGTHTHPLAHRQTDTHTLIYTYTFINFNKHEYSAIFSQGSGECARYMIATTINISESTTNAEQAIPMISNKKGTPILLNNSYILY